MTKNNIEEIQKNQKQDLEGVVFKNSSEVDDSEICAIKNAQKEINNQKEVNKKNCYVGFWARYAAFTIDSIILGIISMSFMFLVGFFSALFKAIFNDSDIVNLFLNFLTYIIELSVFSVYFIFMTYKFQATLGKMAIGAVVKKENGVALSLKEISIREFLKVVQVFFISLPLVVVAFTQKKQGLHDLVAKSIVVCKDPQKGINKWVVGLVIAVHIVLIILATLFIFWVALLVFNGKQ